VLREHADYFAQRLGVDPAVVVSASEQPDDLLAPRVFNALRALKERAADSKAILGNQKAQAAARDMAATAEWDGRRAWVNPGLLLGDLLVDPSFKYVTLQLAGGEVSVRRALLFATAKQVGHRPDITAFVDQAGVHVRWNGGRGGLNWLPQILLSQERASALVVNLSNPSAARKPAPAGPAPSRWSWDVLTDLCAAI